MLLVVTIKIVVVAVVVVVVVVVVIVVVVFVMNRQNRILVGRGITARWFLIVVIVPVDGWIGKWRHQSCKERESLRLMLEL